MVKVKMRYDEDGVHFEDDDADSDEDVDIKDDYYNMGYMGKFNGYDCFRISGKNLPTNKLYVVGAEDKFIKMYDEGDTITIPHNFTETADMTQELLVEKTYGVEVVMASKVGVYTIS